MIDKIPLAKYISLLIGEQWFQEMLPLSFFDKFSFMADKIYKEMRYATNILWHHIDMDYIGQWILQDSLCFAILLLIRVPFKNIFLLKISVGMCF